MNSKVPSLYALVIWLSCGLSLYSQTLVVDFNTPGQLAADFKKATGTMPVQGGGYISSSTGTSSIWYTTDPAGTSTTQPYGFPADSVFAYDGQPFKASLDFLASSSTTGKLTIPGLYIFNPSYTGSNSGVIASFTTNNDNLSSPDSIALRYVNNPVASALGTSIASANPTNAVLNWGTGNTQWLRMELIFTPVTLTSATFTLNLYSIPTSESVGATLIGTTTSAAISFGTTASTLDFSSTTKLAIGIRNYVDTGGSLYLDNLVVQSVPEPGACVLAGLGAVLLIGLGRRRRIAALVRRGGEGQLAI